MSDPAKQSATEPISVEGRTDPEVTPDYNKTQSSLVVSRSASYYWGPTWSAHANLTPGPAKAPLQVEPKDRGPEAEATPISRRDWVEEWRARQLLPEKPSSPDRQVSNIVDAPDTSRQTPTIRGITSREAPTIRDILQDVREHPITREVSANPTRRSLSGPSLFIGVFISAAVVVSAGVIALNNMERRNLASIATRNTELPPALAPDDIRRPEELAEQSRPASALAEANAPTSAVSIASESAPATRSSESPPLPTDGSETRSAPHIPSPEPKPTSTDTGETQASLEKDESVSISQPSPSEPSSPALSIADAAPLQPNSGSPTKLEAKDPSVVSTGIVPGSADAASPVQTDAVQNSGQIAPVPNETMRSVAVTRDALSQQTAATTKETSAESRMPTIDTTALLTRGDALLGIGDIASARLFYERAADAGNAQAAIRLGGTFDPSFLAQARLNGVRGDPAVALKWYKRARDLGASEAEILVLSIERK